MISVSAFRGPGTRSIIPGMELMDAIYGRRSVRRYSDRPVSDDVLRKLIGAAMMAPSAVNQQPWHFITVTDRGKLDAAASVNPHAGMVTKAPAAILVCGDESLEMHPGYWIQDCSAALQNLLLAAHGLGLGAVWTGIWTREERVAGFRQLFSLPETGKSPGTGGSGVPAGGPGEPRGTGPVQ